MRVNKNIASLNIYRAYSENLTKQSGALGRLTSGLKINSSKDDPNAIAQSERLRMQIRGLQMAARNSQDGISMLQTTEGGLDGITNSLQRVRELLVQAGGATSASDRTVIQKEISQMVQGVEDMAKTTNFNGVNLLIGGKNDGTETISSASGANVGDQIEVPRIDTTPEGLGLRSAGVDKVDVNDLSSSLDLVDNALNVVIKARSKFGALENRLESSYNSTIEMADKVQSAESGIRDTDMAEEMIEYAKYNILIEAGNAMMVQSNKFPQDVLRILENVRTR